MGSSLLELGRCFELYHTYLGRTSALLRAAIGFRPKITRFRIITFRHYACARTALLYRLRKQVDLCTRICNPIILDIRTYNSYDIPGPLPLFTTDKYGGKIMHCVHYGFRLLCISQHFADFSWPESLEISPRSWAASFTTPD